MEVVQDLSNIRINNQHKTTTLDIKDLYANLLVRNIISITKFWLDKYNNQNAITKHTLELIKLVLNQNYFQYNDKYYKPTQGTAMGSPLSCTLAEIYLQYIEELMVKHWMEMHEITYYRRYVDVIIIICHLNKINEDLITSYMNSTHKHLECKPTKT